MVGFMETEMILLICCVIIIVLLLVLILKPNKSVDEMRHLKDQVQTFSTLLNETQKVNNDNMNERLREMNDSMQAITDISFKNSDAMRKQLFDTTYKLEEKVDSLTKQNENKLEAMRLTLENKIAALQEDNAKKLDAMRETVDEKLQEYAKGGGAPQFVVPHSLGCRYALSGTQCMA